LRDIQNWRLSFLLAACIILGGTSQYAYDLKLPLYLISLVMIGSVLSSKNTARLRELLTAPAILLIAFMSLFLIYLIPLPASIWTKLEGREFVVDGYRILDLATPNLPISLHPEKTFLALFDFLPIIAVGMITALTKNMKELYFAQYTFLLLVILSAFLGMAQFIDGGSTFSLYNVFNKNRFIGFFSNTNHFASLMVMAMPLALWKFSQAKHKMSSPTQQSRDRFLGGATFIVAFGGVLMSGSNAGYFMALICLPACMAILYSRGLRTTLTTLISFSFIALLLADFFIFSGEIWRFIGKFSNTNATSRSGIFQNAMGWRGDFGQWGIGSGAFREIYTMYEDKSTISTTYVNNAHNDYLQIWIEFGIFGAALIAGFLLWYSSTAIFWMRKRSSKSKVKLIYLLCLLMPLLHSAADYPLRTIAISAIFTFLVAMLCRKETAK